MKFVVFFVVIFVAGSLAQNGNLNKGEQCRRDEECKQDLRDMKCVNNYCGCKKGQRQEFETHPGGSEVYICSEVVGKACSRNDECSVDLDNANCNLSTRRCECNKSQGCTTDKDKGEECQLDEECIDDARHMKCVNYNCGCKKGQRQQERSEGGVMKFICENVIGLGCTRNQECSVDLKNATCNEQSQVCECKKENGCVNGASTMAIMSVLPMVFLSLGLLKYY